MRAEAGLRERSDGRAQLVIPRGADLRTSEVLPAALRSDGRAVDVAVADDDVVAAAKQLLAKISEITSPTIPTTSRIVADCRQ